MLQYCTVVILHINFDKYFIISYLCDVALNKAKWQAGVGGLALGCMWLTPSDAHHSRS